jgi:hypothetical protein
MADGFAFDRGSAVRIADAVRAVENTTRTPTERREPNPVYRQSQLFRRISPVLNGEQNEFLIAATPIEAVQIWDVPGYDYDALLLPCFGGTVSELPEVPEDAPRFEVDIRTLFNGWIAPNEPFLAIKIGEQWYAQGAGHTAITGTLSTASGSPTITLACGLVVPVSFIVDPTTDLDDLEGAQAIACWNGYRFAIQAWGCGDAIP